MTVGSATSREDYTDAGLASFDFSFPVSASTDLEVLIRDTVTGVEITPSFTVVFNDDKTGTITLTAGVLGANKTLMIRRSPELTQPTSFRNQREFYASRHEDALDRVVQQVQRISDDVEHCIRAPLSEAGSIALPPKETRALKNMYFDASGLPAVGSNISNTTVSSYMMPVVQAGSLAAGRAELDPNQGDWLAKSTGSTTARTLAARGADVVNVKDFGAVGNGITDDTIAIQAAINTVKPVYLTAGTYKITAPLSLPTGFTCITGGQDGFAEVGFAAVTIYCAGVTGYVFDVNATTKRLSVSNITFDASNGGGYATASSTMSGVVTCSNPSGSVTPTGLFLENVSAYYSLSTSPCFKLANFVNTKISRCKVTGWVNGACVYTAGTGSVVTTTVIDKCYFNYSRQCVQIEGNTLDVRIYNTVFESCVVAVSAYKAAVSMIGCYFENIGYSTAGLHSTGTALRSFGVTDTPAITGNVTAVITVRNAHVTIQNSTLVYRVVSVPWFEGIGRQSFGSVKFVDCVVPNDVATYGNIFSNTAIDRDNFVYEWHGGYDASNDTFPYTDARALNDGTVALTFSAGIARMRTTVKAGRFHYNSQMVSGVISNEWPVSYYPAGGQNLVGDAILLDAPTAGGFIGKICTTSGTPGTWKTYGAISA